MCRYLSPARCEKIYPVLYAKRPGIDCEDRYLVLHDVFSRYRHYWNDSQWNEYRGVVTWNPAVFEEKKDRFNLVFCPQYMNMYEERAENPIPWSKREYDICAIYGPPASTDLVIMQARYDVPLHLAVSGLSVNAFGVVPDRKRPEYRKRWHELFRGDIPHHRKRDRMVEHRFSICFENSRHPYWACGWVTEKIYDCLGSGTVPIYWGAPNIAEIVPPELFIDYRMFESDDELYRFLKYTPSSTFARMSLDGLEFHDSVDFCAYLDVYESLPSTEIHF